MEMLGMLKTVREILTPRMHWTQGSFALDYFGHMSSPCDPIAVCWCLAGAGYKAVCHLPPAKRDAPVNAMAEALRFVGDGRRSALADMEAWNDEHYRTHAEVLVRLDKAIAEHGG